jgi:hypothetical protein
LECGFELSTLLSEQPSSNKVDVSL